MYGKYRRETKIDLYKYNNTNLQCFNIVHNPRVKFHT